MTNFTYELPPEPTPAEPLEGLSEAALTSLSELAVGPRPAEQLLSPDADAVDGEAAEAKDKETLMKEAWEEMERLASELYPASSGAQKRFLEDFGTYWDETKAEPVIHHWTDEKPGWHRIIDYDYAMTIPGSSHATNRDLTLPRNLLMKTLICTPHNGCRLKSLPDSLRELHCSTNRLEALPDLPENLLVLECQDNELTALPDLPDHLEELRCAGNPLTVLPDLPAHLTRLDCSDSLLIALPDLPRGIVRLSTRNTGLRALPFLPDSLEYIDCSETALTSLPTLPEKLQRLYCQHNYIKTLPLLPAHVKCDFSYNPLDKDSRKRLRRNRLEKVFGHLG